MKAWIGVAAALLLTGCGETEDSGTFDDAAFIQAIEQESTVEDALVTDGGNLYVGVLDNGSDRSGFAMYVCEVARDYATGDVSRKLVKIIDIAAAARDEGIEELGRHWCEF